MGGRSNVKDELLCRFIFPERPGALMKFLDALSPRWNISLFHYRGQVGNPISSMHIYYHYLYLCRDFTFLLHLQGETGANVLVGIQVAQTEMEEFRHRANSLGYEYELETANEAFRLLMR